MKLLGAPERKKLIRRGSITINRIPPKSCYYDSNNSERTIDALLEPDDEAIKQMLSASKRAPKRK